MARLSIYEGPLSMKSQNVIDRMLKTSSMTPQYIEHFQHKYNVSMQELARLSGHSLAQVSVWKSEGREIPERVQQHFRLLFEEFERQFNK